MNRVDTGVAGESRGQQREKQTPAALRGARRQAHREDSIVEEEEEANVKTAKRKGDCDGSLNSKKASKRARRSETGLAWISRHFWSCWKG